MKGRVLIAAGSDSGGGAGIQADIKTVTALGGYAATAITALTAQDTNTVYAVHPVPAEFVAEQMRVVLADIGADCIKTGMIHSVPIIEAVAEIAERHANGVPLVVDPVLVAKGGASLLEPSAMRALANALIGRADLVTPNIPEAERLTGLTVATVDDMARAAERIHRLGPSAVLVKGGHLESDEITDLLSHPGGIERFHAPRIESRHTHGTGCTLASAIATGIAQGLSLVDAVARARRYLRHAIEAAPGLGAGHGPVNHGVTVSPTT
ncbi:MAG: bifunctional hydroxymethylpyrimidine kinase/phosphomethylpyrimidine kinase [Rhodospirillales bacterium]|nr:bifunctional hydroxymethylpyrimidine kinase/phosphomethylpyrimidine kinase [Rhodospirillales bacterium]